MPEESKLSRKTQSPKNQPVVSATYQEIYAGPIPHPDVFNKYPDRVQEFILTNTEKQIAHRHKLEQKLVDTDVKATLIGTWVTSIICIIAVVSGFALILAGKDGLGITSILVPVVIKGISALASKANHHSSSEDETPKKP